MGEDHRVPLTDSIRLCQSWDGGAPEEYQIKSVVGTDRVSICYEAARVRPDGTLEAGKLREFYPCDEEGDSFALERMPNGQLLPHHSKTKEFVAACNDYLKAYRLVRKTVEDPKNEVLKSYLPRNEILYGELVVRPSAETKEAKKSENTSWLAKLLGYRETSETQTRSTASVWSVDGVGKSYAYIEVRTRSSVYLWSTEVSGKNFETYLKEQRGSPTQKPEEALHEILSIMVSLTDCIKALHVAGLLHLDIKPSNFMLPYDSDFQIRPDSIFLHDISTLRRCDADKEERTGIGTKGYCAPEEVKTNQSDIYSIGATLFHAVILLKDIPDGLYQDGFYDQLPMLVKRSSLFESIVNSDAAVISRICRILQKCLAMEPGERYESCDELKADLKEAIRQLEVLLDRQRMHEKNGLADPRIAIQKLLYEHPLYQTVDPKAQELNVLLLGAGSYGQTFLDCCLQVGQMMNTRLNLFAVSDDPDTRQKEYLEFRPALPEFVNVDGSLEGKEETAFASLQFLSPAQLMRKPEDALRLDGIHGDLVEQMAEATRNSQREYSYIFVALDDDVRNGKIAREMQRVFGGKCPVAYTLAREGGKTDDEKLIYPVWIHKPLEISSIDKDLAEMAFNTHMTWMSAMNTDVVAERKKFFDRATAEDRYNFSSSISFVLSIQYKFHSIGLDYGSPEEGAKCFAEILERRSTDPEAQKQFQRLVAMEHRRWVMDRVVCGWTAPRTSDGKLDLQSCVIGGSVKGKVHLTHPCLVRSRDDAPLETEAYQANHHAKWDEGPIDPSLDELDRMSIELHRCFKKSADEFRRSGSYQTDLAFLRDQFSPDDGEAFQVLGQYEFALKNILRGSESYSRQYDHYQDQLERIAARLPGERGARFRDRMAVLKKLFFPVVESNLYRDYKATDKVLVEAIPFILTYRYARSIAAVLEDGRRDNGRNEAVFSSVAAAAVLSPERLCYFYCFDEDAEAELLDRKLRAVLDYFHHSTVHCKIQLMVCCLSSVSKKEHEALGNVLEALAEQLDAVQLADAADPDEASQKFLQMLEEEPVDLFDYSNLPFSPRSFAAQNMEFLSALKKLGQPRFQFDWKHKEFTGTSGCDYLRYVKNDTFIRVQDMFALANAADCKFNVPELAEDYKELWEIYTSGCDRFEKSVNRWNQLCADLARYDDENTKKVTIPKYEVQGAKKKIWFCFLPDYTFQSVQKLLRKMVRFGLALADSNVIRYTSDTCKLTLHTWEPYLENLKKVFWEPQLLLAYYEPRIERRETTAGPEFLFRCNDMKVNEAILTYPSNDKEKILRKLQEKGFIRGLEPRWEGKNMKVSFVYTSPRIRRMMTNAGEILEIYAYYSVLESGYFDDVVTGYTFSWADNDLKNELDLVLTKGFRSMIVECKAVPMLNADYYYKLDSLVQKFGIGTLRVLVGNTYDDHTARNASQHVVNRYQKKRGDAMEIETITERDEILNIGQVLANRMEAEL